MSRKSKTDSTCRLTLTVQPLDSLHKHIGNLLKSIVSDRLLNRYCSVCFFGTVNGELFGMPICKSCYDSLFPNGVEKASPGAIVMFQSFAMLARDSREALYMKIKKEFENEDKTI